MFHPLPTFLRPYHQELLQLLLRHNKVLLYHLLNQKHMLQDGKVVDRLEPVIARSFNFQ
jgi:hypothetical protein